ncbi:hypothetical protein MTR_6g464340 [Medicago truncatula]|uniref:Uncharacterized protein n=1 Tax=Medicago truncatula TaxID=3880 RepID=A0A072U9S5_MEDTR|nr:hypothetical protein MTR_6g464340 [Medicago truncatula]
MVMVKLVLLLVLQSIPDYIMSIYVRPNSIIDDNEKMTNAFCLGGGGNSLGIKWISWERVACAKEFGGTGIRNFNAFNLSMVTKQGWSFLCENRYWSGMSPMLMQRTDFENCLTNFVFDVWKYESGDIGGRVALLLWHLWDECNTPFSQHKNFRTNNQSFLHKRNVTLLKNHK